MSRVMLIFPPFTQPTVALKRCMVPMGIAYIAGYLRQYGHDVKILDAVVEGYNNDVIDGANRTFGLSLDEIRFRIQAYKPEFVVVSCLMTQQFTNALNVCRIAKDCGAHTIIGGCHPSVFAQEVLAHSEIDTVVVGEGEQAVLDVVNDKLCGIVQREHLNIDTIPFPARDLLNMEAYIQINMPENIYSPYDRVTQIVTSRGCPFKCVFCATTRFHGKWRGRSAESVIEEARHLRDTYGIQELNIIDENFIMDRERTVKILNGFIELGMVWSNPGGILIAGLDNDLLDLMKKAGCYQLTFPVESSNNETLHHVIGKPLNLDIVKPLVTHCKKIGIDTHAFFVCGFPHETLDDMKDNYRFAYDVGFDSASFNIVCPMPGSALYNDYKDIVDIRRIHYSRATIPNAHATGDEIEALVRDMNIRFNRSLLWRNPVKFIRKYVKTAVKKYSIFELPRMFMRQ